MRPISGGLLLQQRDALDAEGKDKDGNPTGDDPSRWRLVAGDAASEETLADLAFAWQAIRAVKSNAILLASGGASVGVGMGQVNRVDSCHLAVTRAGERAAGRSPRPTRSSRSRTAPQILIDAGVTGDRPARRLDPRRGGHRRRAGRRRDDVLHRHPALRALRG